MTRRLSAAASATLLFILVTGLLIYRFLPTRPLAQSVFTVLQVATTLLVLFDGGATVEVLNAGHPPLIHFRGRTSSRWTTSGPLLGFSGTDHSVRTTAVTTDDLIVICTDGLEEARAPDRDPLGDQRLLDLVAAYASEPPQRIADALVDAALEHSGRRLNDDALIVVLRKTDRTSPTAPPRE